MMEDAGREEVKDFLSDICAYLEDALRSAEYENTSHDSQRVMLAETLHLRCKKLLLYFNGANGNTKDELDECAYLDMNGKSNTHVARQPNLEASNAAIANDYVLMNRPAPKQNGAENPVEEIVQSGSQSSVLKSPVVGGQNQSESDLFPYGLIPAKFLDTENLLHENHLLRLGSRNFFSLSKKYYSRLLPEYLLCYPDASAERKPSLSLCLKGAKVCRCGDSKRHQHCFEVNVASGKRYMFQSESENDLEAWISSICLAISSHSRKPSVNSFRNRSNAAITPSNEFYGQIKLNRKLPTPPVSKSRDLAGVKDERSSDDIYEEPYKLYQGHKGNYLTSDMLATHSDDFPPKELPKIMQPSSESYDIPKSRRSVPLNLASLSNLQNQLEMDWKPPTDGEEGAQSTLSSSRNLVMVEPVAEANEITQVRGPMVDNPLEMRDGRLLEPEQIQDGQNLSPTPSPVSRWLRKKFGMTSCSLQWNSKCQTCSTTLTSNVQCKKPPIHGPQGAEKTPEPRILLPFAKGTKVNMIASQLLDSKGGLPIFKCNASQTVAAATNSSL